VDGTEIPIEKPRNVNDQSCTFSTYKNKNTLKVLAGISPKGSVTYVSDAYGGSCSDRQIVERSALLDKSKFSNGDSIMSDRGFVVKHLFLPFNVHVNIPSFLKGASQLPAEAVVRDRRIAHLRIHVERLIGLAKTYKILKHELPHQYVPLGGRLIYVCLILSNFKPNIV